MINNNNVEFIKSLIQFYETERAKCCPKCTHCKTLYENYTADIKRLFAKIQTPLLENK